MPLIDERLEKFCQEIARDASVEAAMHNAGYSATNAYFNGSRMLQKPHVADRVTELCREMGKEFPNTPPRPRKQVGGLRTPLPVVPEEVDLSKINYDWVLREAVTAYVMAKTQRNATLMVKLLDQIGRLTGIDKRPNGRPPQKKDPNKGDVSNDKPQPTNPIGFEEFVEAVGGSGSGAGIEPTDEDGFDAEAEGDSSEV